MTAGAQDITNGGGALGGLVHQVARPWAFLRGLVQNAIDAGTEQLDVRIEHDEPRGTMIVEVVDFGEGMTREIIDTRLTRLFSSAKEGDYTKIGRFGIGFVSVFATDPELVCVDTGRAGEWWRVVFRRDRSFERIRLHSPVEGTTVRLYKPVAGAAEVEQARQRARETLQYWCKHVKIELRLDGEVVSGPLDLDGLCKVEHREDGTTLVMALVADRRALRGYYHGGLTLHEEHSEDLPHVAFKIDSRYLEHSLTRDNVIRDENYAKAMAIVGQVARTRLVDAMFAALERIARGGPASPAARELLYRSAAAQVAGGGPGPARCGHPGVPPSGGAPLPRGADEELAPDLELWRARAPSPAVDRLLADGHRVIDCDADDGVAALVAAALRERPTAVASVCVAPPVSAAEAERWAPLCAGVAALLRASKYRAREVTVAHLGYPGSPVAQRVAISQAKPGELTPIADIDQLGSGWLASSRVLVISADHAIARSLRAVAGREPELAAYLLLKAFLLRGALTPALDGELAAAAAEARWRRTAA